MCNCVRSLIGFTSYFLSGFSPSVIYFILPKVFSPALLNWHASAGSNCFSCLCLHSEDHHDFVRKYSSVDRKTSKSWAVGSVGQAKHCRMLNAKCWVYLTGQCLWLIKTDTLQKKKKMLKSNFDIDFSLISVCSSELTEKDYDGKSAIYWEVKYPFPLSNRDVSYRNISQWPISLLNVFLKGPIGLSLPLVAYFLLYLVQCMFAFAFF